MAHTKAISAGRYGKDSQPKYLGVKLSGGQAAKIGSVIIRQRGTKFVAGPGTRQGSDDTVYAVRVGKVKFATKQVRKFDGNRRMIKVVSVT